MVALINKNAKEYKSEEHLRGGAVPEASIIIIVSVRREAVSTEIPGKTLELYLGIKTSTSSPCYATSALTVIKIEYHVAYINIQSAITYCEICISN